MSRPKEFNPEAVLLSPRAAAVVTGLSIKVIRRGCREGSIPCMKVGADFRIHMPEFLKQLESMCKLKSEDHTEKAVASDYG